MSRLEAEHPNLSQLFQLIAKSLLFPNFVSYFHPPPPFQLLPIASPGEREFVELDAFPGQAN